MACKNMPTTTVFFARIFGKKTEILTRFNLKQNTLSLSFSKMHLSTKRGALVVFEGCDKSGKTTQCMKLVEVMQKEGHKVQFLRFPERSTAIGKVIGEYLEKKCELEDHAVHLLFSANRWEAVPKMKELLQSGTTLIVDRYSFSGVAFTAAKQNMDLNWCKQPEIGLPKPDAVLYLTLSAEEAARRSTYGVERYEETDFQKRVAANYSQLIEDNWKVIDASKGIEELHKEIKDIVKETIVSCEHNTLETLWTSHEVGSNGVAENCPSNKGDQINSISNSSGDTHNGKINETGKTNGSTTSDTGDATEEPVSKRQKREVEESRADSSM